MPRRYLLHRLHHLGFLWVMLLLAVVVCAGCSKPSASSPQELRVGMELAYPPFEMTDAAGHPAGISVDLAQALGNALDRPVRIENMAFDGLIPALQARKIDLILSSMTVTPERERAIAFSDPYLKTGLALLAAKDSPVASAADLDRPDRKIAVKNGTTGQLYARDHLSHAQILLFDSEAAALLEVAQGKVDVFLYDQMSVLRASERYPGTRPLLTAVQEEAWAIGLRRGSDEEELRGKVNEFLKRFRAQGGFEALGDRYLKDAKAAFVSRGIPFVF